MNIRPSPLSRLTPSLLVCCLGLMPASAEQLYTINAYNSSNIVDTGTDDVLAGFTFRIQTGYQATADKISIWVKDVSQPLYNGEALYERSGSTWSELRQTNITRGETPDPAYDCIYLGSFCETSIGPTVTLVSGVDYMLIASYSPVSPANLYYLDKLPSSQASFANHVDFLSNWFGDPNISGSGPIAGMDRAAFGVNLGGVNVTAVPVPSTPVPAPSHCLVGRLLLPGRGD